MRCSRWFSGLAVLWFAALCSTSSADLPGNRNGGRRPEPVPQPVETVRVTNSVTYIEQPKLEGEEEAVVAKIVLPRKVLLQLLNQQEVAPGAAPTAAPGRTEAPIGGTVIAGLCLAAAMVAGGIAWKRTATRRTVGGAAILLAFLGVATSGLADLGPPLPRPAQPTKVIDNHPKASFKVVLETVVEEGPVQIQIKR